MLLLTAACGILTIVVILMLTSQHEPTAQGHPLSYWIQVYSGPTRGKPPTVQEVHEAAAAIKQIGTNAIPFLLEWMDYETPRWKLTLWISARKLLNLTGKSGPGKWLYAVPNLPDGWAAAMSFAALGPTAAPAIHQLEVRAQRNSSERKSRAFFALSYVGPKAVPAISRVLSRPDYVTDMWTMASLAHMGTNALPLVPLLVQHLDDTNALAAAACAQTLGSLRLEPDFVIPALMHKLGDPRTGVSNQIPLALVDFGSPALIQLTNALTDPSPVVRRNATNAFAIIMAPPQKTSAAPSPYE
jgi:hypothetical protein